MCGTWWAAVRDKLNFKIASSETRPRTPPQPQPQLQSHLQLPTLHNPPFSLDHNTTSVVPLPSYRTICLHLVIDILVRTSTGHLPKVKHWPLQRLPAYQPCKCFPYSTQAVFARSRSLPLLSDSQLSYLSDSLLKIRPPLPQPLLSALSSSVWLSSTLSPISTTSLSHKLPNLST